MQAQSAVQSEWSMHTPDFDALECDNLRVIYYVSANERPLEQKSIHKQRPNLLEIAEYKQCD